MGQSGAAAERRRAVCVIFAERAGQSYDVSFKLKTSTGSAGEGTVNVTVGQTGGKWVITGLKPVSGSEA